MSYEKHIFRSGEKLYASQLNEMEQQIATNEEQLNALNTDLAQLKQEIGTGGSGLSDAIKQAWRGHITEVAYKSVSHPYTDTLLSLLDGTDEPDTPVDPGDPPTPTRTLQSISATYTGGDVDAGTLATSLTGITVTGHYNVAPLTETVTGWTISGTVEEGSNTFTISYGGKTTTITVTGVAVPTHSWTSGVPYEDLGWTAGVINSSTGEKEDNTSNYVTDYIDVAGVTAFKYTGTPYANYLPAYYDSDKNYIGRCNSLASTSYKDANIAVPPTASYMRLYATNANYSGVTITPYKFPVLNENTAFESGKLYSLGGWVIENNQQTNTVKAKCAGATKINVNMDFRNSCVFYDIDGEYLSTSGPGNNKSYTVPQGACYFRIYYSIVYSTTSKPSTGKPLSYVWLE